MILTRSLNKDEFDGIGPALKEIANSVKSSARVNGKTHLHYKYPAGFSPEFPNAVVRAFTKPGDLILDPFMGGGTSLIEASNLGRKSIGIDVNELAVFTAKLKTIRLSSMAVAEVEEWFENIFKIDRRTLTNVPGEYSEYFKELPRSLANVIFHITKSVEELRFDTTRHFARGVLLRATQLLLDNRTFEPTVVGLFDRLKNNFDIMLEQSMSYGSEMKRTRDFFPEIYHGDCRNLGTVSSALVRTQNVKAVVTSPPYPGVHVLYNRWQYRGRREIALPYFIIGSRQNLSPSFFTMGNRHTQTGIEMYFNSIKEVYSNIGHYLEPGTPVIQLVAFNDKKNQLDAFLQAMKDAGFAESKAYGASDSRDGRLWRIVPHRKWYNSLGNSSHSSHEVALIHRKK